MQLVIPEAKIVEYLLANPRKSGFFLPLGYAVADWTVLRDDLLRVARECPWRLRRHTPYGAEYEVAGEIRAPNGAMINVRTGWMVGEPGVAVFVTAYPA